jgi:hypothetical protein
MGKLQTLVFRTKSKTTTLYEDMVEKNTIPSFSFDNVNTVAIRDDGYYEIMVKSGTQTLPTARLPITCTNMIILNE